MLHQRTPEPQAPNRSDQYTTHNSDSSTGSWSCRKAPLLTPSPFTTYIFLELFLTQDLRRTGSAYTTHIYIYIYGKSLNLKFGFPFAWVEGIFEVSRYKVRDFIWSQMARKVGVVISGVAWEDGNHGIFTLIF